MCRNLLARKEKKAAIFNTAQLSLTETKKAVRDTLSSYKIAKKEDKELRDKFIEKLSEDRAEQNNTTKKKNRKR